MEPAPIKASEDAVYAVEGTAVAEPEAEVEESVEIEETEMADELVTAAPEEEIDIFDMPDDPDAAIAWLEAMAASDEDFDIEMEPAPIKPSEDAVYVVEDTAAAEPEVEAEEVETAVAEIEEIEEAETDLDDLLEMPEDPDEALAWFEAMAASDEAFDIEMEPDPIKASEDAVYVVEGTAVAEVEAEDDLPEAAEAVEESVETMADEAGEAAGWLDALAAQPEVDVAAGEVADVPDWMVAEADVSDDLLAEAELLAVDSELEAEDDLLDEEPFEAPLEQDVSDAMPAWFDLDADDPLDEGQTGWLNSLPEVDVDSWLIAEEEATAQAVEELEILPETDNLGPALANAGDLRMPGDTGLLSSGDDEFAVVEPDSSISYSIDEEALAAAKTALANGRYDEAADKYQELVAAGGGMMVLIAELETAVAAQPDQPAFQRALGDAYMRNGQLQKALETYRMALDSL
jgi:tetratricopeptide (TPR) repeat protein